MSTLISQENKEVPVTQEELNGYFQRFIKAPKDRRIGIEAEFFGVDHKTGQALPYAGPGGIREILGALSRKFGFEPIKDLENVIGLKCGPNMITLEPGGQLELSAPPVFNIFEIEKQIRDFIKELKCLSPEFPHAAWLAVGMQPFSHREDISWVPKRRYKIMAEYLGARGNLAHDMMKRTATNQVNLDFTSEADALEALQLVLRLTSMVSALFANSAFSEGRPNGFFSRRLAIWAQTDPERTGLLARFLEPGKMFRDYLDYSLDLPMIFIFRKNEWIPMKGRRFREFLQKGFEGWHATLADFELHLSANFPEARFKPYLEIRGADCQSRDLIPSVAAFWKGILYDPTARREAVKIVSPFKPVDFLKLHAEVPAKGFRARLGDCEIFPMLAELVDIACAGLGREPTGHGQSECVFLDALRERIIRPGKSPAETLLEKWGGEFGQDPGKLIQYLNILES